MRAAGDVGHLQRCSLHPHHLHSCLSQETGGGCECVVLGYWLKRGLLDHTEYQTHTQCCWLPMYLKKRHQKHQMCCCCYTCVIVGFTSALFNIILLLHSYPIKLIMSTYSKIILLALIQKGSLQLILSCKQTSDMDDT